MKVANFARNLVDVPDYVSRQLYDVRINSKIIKIIEPPEPMARFDLSNPTSICLNIKQWVFERCDDAPVDCSIVNEDGRWIVRYAPK